MATSLTYKEPIRVICINSKHSTKLIQGATYFAKGIYTKTWGNKERNVTLEGVGTYSLKYFTLMDGRPLNDEPDFSVPYGKSVDTKNNNYTGQFVRCRWSSGKSMKEGEIYYVEEQRTTQTINKYNKAIITDVKFKIRGVRNCVNPYRFEEIPLIEQRSIKLKKLKGQDIKTGEQTRKFLLYDDKEKTKILFETLYKVVFDLSKVELEKPNLIELMIIKGKNYVLVEEDIKPFLKGKLDTLLKPLL